MHRCPMPKPMLWQSENLIFELETGHTRSPAINWYIYRYLSKQVRADAPHVRNTSFDLLNYAPVIPLSQPRNDNIFCEICVTTKHSDKMIKKIHVEIIYSLHALYFIQSILQHTRTTHRLKVDAGYEQLVCVCMHLCEGEILQSLGFPLLSHRIVATNFYTFLMSWLSHGGDFVDLETCFIRSIFLRFFPLPSAPVCRAGTHSYRRAHVLVAIWHYSIWKLVVEFQNGVFFSSLSILFLN